jgi:hypothetical protein
MATLEETIGRLITRGANRAEMISELAAMSDRESLAISAFGRSSENSLRINRVLHFLQHGVLADSATEADAEICHRLNEYFQE